MKFDDIREQHRVLKSSTEIQARIADLGREISADYGNEELIVVGVLKGAFMFMSDLVRHLNLPVSCDFIRASSYGDRRATSGVVKLELDVSQPVTGKHVLLVEDIVDTGLTLTYLRENFSTRHPKSLRVCTFLHKPEMSPETHLDYVGFKIPNEFVVGYGLDLAGRYRNLPFLAALHPEGPR